MDVALTFIVPSRPRIRHTVLQQHTRSLWASASRRPPCLPDRWPDPDSPLQETRPPQRPYSLRLASRPSSSAARRSPRYRLTFRRLDPSPSRRPRAPRQVAHQGQRPAISVFAYVPARAASRISARSDRQTQTQHREQKSKASSPSPQLNITRHCRKPLMGNCQVQAPSPRANSLVNSSTVAGGTLTRRALAFTCSSRDMPTSAVVIPGEERTNCNARSASLARPRASATNSGRFLATWPCSSEALAISEISSSLAASMIVR